MKTFTRYLLLVSSTLAFNSIFATEQEAPDYFEKDVNIAFKIQAFGALNSAKQKGLKTPTVSSPKDIGNLFSNGYGLNTITDIFLNNNFSAELSLGFELFKFNTSALSNIANNYEGSNDSKKKSIYAIPFAITGKYHIAPFGGISPYVGAGYQAVYAISKPKACKVGMIHGPVLQAGVDLISKEDTTITFDIKNVFRKTKISYKNPLVKNEFSSNVNMNSLIISLGVGFNL